MSGLWAMASGVLARDPERRTGAKGIFAVASIRVGAGDAVQSVSTIAFADNAERLLSLHSGDAVSVSGRAELKSWTDKSGAKRTGLSVVANEIAAARPKPRPRDAAPRQDRPRPRQRDAAPRQERPTPRPAYDGPPLDDSIDDLYPQVRR